MSKRILIGKIVSAHGIKGLVKVLPLCEDVDLLTGRLFTSEDGPETLDVKIKSSAGKSLLAEIKGITDRNAAEALKCSLFAPREALPETDGDEFYITDLIGMDVYDGDQNIGTVRAVDNFGASDLLDVKPLSGKSFYIPFAEQYVLGIDFDKNQITVTDIFDFIEH